MKHILLILFLIPTLSFSQNLSQYENLDEAIEEEKYENIIDIIKDLLSNTYIENEKYNEGNLYAILATAYHEIDNKDAYNETLQTGISKYPTDTTMIELYLSQLLKEDNKTAANKFVNDGFTKYPDHRGLFLFLKGRFFLMDEDYLSAEPIYEELFKLEPKNGQGHMDFGYYSLEYARKMNKLWKSDPHTKAISKKEVIKYYEKAADHMTKGYEYSPNANERVKENILYFANEAVLELEELGVNIDKYIKWSRKMGIEE